MARTVNCVIVDGHHVPGADDHRGGEYAQPVQVRQDLRPVDETRVTGAGRDATIQTLAQLADHPRSGVGPDIEQGLEPFKKRRFRGVRGSQEPPAAAIGAGVQSAIARVRRHLCASRGEQPARRAV